MALRLGRTPLGPALVRFTKVLRVKRSGGGLGRRLHSLKVHAAGTCREFRQSGGGALSLRYRRAASTSEAKSSSSGGEGTPFLLADIGEGITEVEVLKWFVKAGDEVTQFQKLVEVQSDKATVDITSRFDGTVSKLGYSEGDIAAVGTPLCYIQTESSAKTETMKRPAEEHHGASKVQAKQASSENKWRPQAAPPVRKLAKEHNIELKNLSGSGPGGRILESDVLSYVESLAKVRNGYDQEAESTASPGKYRRSLMQRGFDDFQERVEPIRGLQRAMVKTMTAALAVPHLNIGEEICMDEIVRIKNALAPWAMERYNTRITFLPLMIKATSLALKLFPILNSRTDDKCENIIYQPWHNISIAMDTPQGLVVPNIKRVQQLSVLEIAGEMQRLADEAKAGRFREEDLAGGTFALSNVGSIAGTYTSPVLMHPQVAIGALGRIQKLPRFGKDGNVEMSRVAHVTWAADHRIIDGATIANFSNLWKRHVENPAEMLLELR
mmetsp:Transcript_10623/g.32508  ORF Transcript_10623/g.32508 Transcript_10623/m.32508 type:complete len:497 (+) Transcript_10623:90-1580(+)